MKKLKSILLILVFSSFFFGFTHVDKRHIGKWQYNEDGEVGTFIFQENGYALMIMDGDTLGGESYLIDGEEYSLKYSVLYTKDPYYITLTMYFKNSGIRVSTMKGIFKYNENGDMVICLDSEEGPRPTSFRKDDTATLKKIK